MSLITIHWRAPPKGGDFLYVVVYMRRALALCSLHDEDIILHILSSAESPGRFGSILLYTPDADQKISLYCNIP